MFIQISNAHKDYPSSSDQDDQYLKTIRNNFLPPNQIVTKQYQPDIQPTIKLVDNQLAISNLRDSQQNDSLGLMNKNLYKYEFQQEDSLGYYYAKGIKNGLVYLKFDNRSLFRCSENRKKYLAGLFMPLNNLLRPEIKLVKNIYQAIREREKKIIYIPYQDKIEESFKMNCFSSQKQVKFSSNYASSNLFMAIKTGQFQYDLILQNDINSKGTTQWFNFAVQFIQDGIYKFNIVNLSKCSSLFQKGMKIPYFSYNNNLSSNISWQRGCTNIRYEKNSIFRQNNSQITYNTLHFEYINSMKNDKVIFSYCFPYTGLDLEKFFNKITHKRLSINLRIEKQQICQTISGLPVFVYHISPKKSMSSLHKLNGSILDDKFSRNKISQTANQAIVFLARQHPGESQSSFILEGIIQFLLQNNQYDTAKKGFHYFIFPLVNPDGVFYGNYRTNLSGNDLNRVWKEPRRDFHPQVYFIKRYLQNVNRTTQIKLVVDIHGHSSALGSFFYGNPSRKQGGFQVQNPRLFPYYCSRQMKEISFSQSTFNISQDKKGSARIVLNQMFPKASVYTLQNSFFGYRKGKRVVQYTVERYRKLGRNFICSYLEFIKITQRIPLIKQKWQKEIQAINIAVRDQKLHNTTKQNSPSDSDSEAGNELLQFQQQYEKIDQQLDKKILAKDIQTKDKLKVLYNNNNKSLTFKGRLYERKISKYQSNIIDCDGSRFFSNGVLCLQRNNINVSQLNLSAQQGFLSIVKIDTKKSLIQKADQERPQQQHQVKRTIVYTQQVDNEHQNNKEKQNHLINNNKVYNNKLINKRITRTALNSPSLNSPSLNSPLLNSPSLNSPLKDMYSKKQYTVAEMVQNKNSYTSGDKSSLIMTNDRNGTLLVDKKQVRLMNEKQYMLKHRRTVNKFYQEKQSKLAVEVSSDEVQRLVKQKQKISINKKGLLRVYQSSLSLKTYLGN